MRWTGVIVLAAIIAVIVTGRLMMWLVPGVRIALPLPPTFPQKVRQVPSALSVGVTQTHFVGADSCNLGAIDGRHYSSAPVVSRAAVTALGGWIVDTVARRVPREVWVVLVAASGGGSYEIPVRLFTARPDVQNAFGGSRTYEWSGFIVQFSNRRLAPGEYHVYMVFKRGPTFVTCDNGRHLVVGG